MDGHPLIARRLIAYALVTALALLVPVAVWSAPAPTRERAVVALTTDALTLDPALITSTNERILSFYLFDYLLARAPDGKLVPWLAESYKNLDRTTWEFKLRRNIRFHNGEPFNAEAVQFAFHYVLDPANRIPGRGQLAAIKEVKIVDEFTVHFITHDADPILPARMLRQPPYPPRLFRERGREYFLRNPVGTGPYIFKEWVKDERIIAEANPNYWGPAPRIKTIVFRPIPEYATRMSLLRTGEVDLVTHVVPDQAAAVGRIAGIKVSSSPSLRTMYLALRPDMPPLDKKEVRQALNFAIDKDAIVKDLLKGFGVVTRAQIISSVFFGYHPGLKAYPHDPQRARELLTQAGHSNGIDLTFYTPSGRYTLDREIAEAIVAQWAKVGIRARLAPVEWGVYARYQLEGRFAHVNLLAATGLGDAPDSYSSAFRTGEPWGVGLYWSHAEVDRLIVVGQSSMNTKSREQAAHKVAQIVREQAPVVFLHHMVEIYAARDGIDFAPRPDDIVDLFGLGRLNR